jgi:hypothetical protein
MFLENNFTIFKKMLVNTPAYRLLLEFKAVMEKYLINRTNDVGGTKAYCISPYRSATTYISRIFAPKHRVWHEPLHFVTLQHLDNPLFLARRASFLNLDLESSGFFANRLSVLRQFAPKNPVLFVSRDPQSWMESLVNFFPLLTRRIHYNYVARLYFDPICQAPIEKFYEMKPVVQERMIKNLLEFWLAANEAAMNDANTLVIPIALLDERIDEVESFLGLNASSRLGIDRHENTEKRSLVIRDYFEADPYLRRVAALGYSL